ncbi:unnamed protein product [Ceratitis capitata]|uniref:(Mediterranean fruit fly) hypothetical protein n=1 Tax=Ceratitis capitata TaxID=7213 RepID=A0A811UJT0_CERCA|nr:unnamed protein product [Ceratitis capitata]
MVGNAQQQMGGMPGQMNAIGSSGPGGPGGPGGPSQQMQIGPGQMQGGPMNVNAMNVQQMQQMTQQQMAQMGMNHQQLNQMMNARLNAGGPMGPNTGPQGMQGMPPNMQQNQSGPMHGGNVVGGPQGQQGGGIPQNAGQQGGMGQMIGMGPNMQQKPNMPMGQGGQMFQVNRGVPGQQQQFLRQSPSPSTRQMRQSPSAPLNTPGQVASNSPFNPQEDHLYREKYKQLTKYIEPLKRMMAKIGTDGANTEKFTKMSKLLEILSNPNQRVPLETLLKCEKALEKLDIVNFAGQQFGKSSNPLMEVVNTALQSPLANHTLHRTYRPCLELLLARTYGNAPAPPKRQRVSEKPSQYECEIPHILQGEIARLDQKFKLTLDNTTQNNPKSIKVVCCLDDKRLPCVPPITVTIPEEYPSVSPSCALTQHEYGTTPFLKAVQDAFKARIAKLPKLYSLSHLLDTWEMSVRQACSPSTKNVLDLAAVFGA